MKKLASLILFMFLSCGDDPLSYNCDPPEELCNGKKYRICCEYSDCWFEVNGEEYYTVEYMTMVECGW
jgi:hypothetical protein